MTRMTANFMLRKPGPVKSQPGSQFVLRDWKQSDTSLAADSEHSEASIVDGDITTAVYIPSPSDDKGILVNFNKPYLLCQILILAGNHDQDLKGDSFVSDSLYGNDGSIELSKKVSHPTRAVVTFKEPTNLYNIFIKFSGHKQWLRIREVVLTRATEENRDKCT